MSVKVTYEVESQPIANLWNEARNSESPSLDHKDADAFKAYLNMLVAKAFIEGRKFQRNLKEDEKYG